MWPSMPPQNLHLGDGDPAVPLNDFILQDTRSLDSAVDPGELSREVYRSLTVWAKRHAVSLGFEPSFPIALESAHVTYQIDEDRQTRPKIVLQLVQRRPDLEASCQPDVAESERTPLRAGTTLIARVDGMVEYVIPKPLPLKSPVEQPEVMYVHLIGTDRLHRMQAWFADLDDRDALSVWTEVPAVQRLNFASLHCDDTPASYM